MIPISTALKSSIRGYSIRRFGRDFQSAIIVSLVALPISMAFSIAVGLPPQNGIYTAIVAGIIVPLLGGSMYQVSGPTAAFIVILAPVIAQYGLRGLIWGGMLAGIMMVIMGLLRWGKLINYIPYPVTTGFTMGIAIVILTSSLNDLTGIKAISPTASYFDKIVNIITHIQSTKLPEILVGGITLIILLTIGTRPVSKRIPIPLVAILAGTLIAYYLNENGVNVTTIGNKFYYLGKEGYMVAGVPDTPPKFNIPGLSSNPLFSFPDFQEWNQLFFPALTIALLASLESLLSATVADSLTNTRHNPNAELIGIGIGNILSSMCMGMPATGAIARTATNIQSGGTTVFSAAIHGVLILIYVVLLGKYLTYVPMASLAALLLVIAYKMSHIQQFLKVIKIAPFQDTMVMLTCFGLTVFVDMVAGVTVGIVLAALLLIRRVADLTDSSYENAKVFSRNNQEMPDDVVIYNIRGPLFFGTVEKAYSRTDFGYQQVNTLILNMAEVPFVDITGLVALKSMILTFASNNNKIILCGKSVVLEPLKRKLESEKLDSKVEFYDNVNAALASIIKPA